MAKDVTNNESNDKEAIVVEKIDNSNDFPKPADKTNSFFKNLKVKANDDSKSVTGLHIRRHISEKTKSKNAFPLIIIALVVVVLLIIGITIGAFVRKTNPVGLLSGEFKEKELNVLSLYNGKTVKEVEGASNLSTFKVNEPILVKLNINVKDQENLNIQYNVTNSKNDEVRKGSFQVTGVEGKDSIDRYISISSGTRTMLEKGSYTLTISTFSQNDDSSDSAEKKIGVLKFKVVE